MPDLLEAIYRSIEYCLNRNAMLSTDKILLTGGTSYLKDLGSFVEEVLDIPTSTWNPISDLEKKGKAKTLSADPQPEERRLTATGRH